MFFKCSITRHTNKQRNIPQSKQQNKSLETNLKETQTSELLDEDFKNRLNKNKGKQRDLRKPEKQYMNKIRVSKKNIKKREKIKIKKNK